MAVACKIPGYICVCCHGSGQQIMCPHEPVLTSPFNLHLVNHTDLPACYGQSPCPNSPNACYCTGQCNNPKNFGTGSNPANAAICPEAATFVTEHNAQKEVRPGCNTRDYVRPTALTPVGEERTLRVIQNAMVTDAKDKSAACRQALEQRIERGELDPGINAGKLIMPKDAQYIDLQEMRLIQDTLSEVADQVALEGAVNVQFAPLKDVLNGLEDILRYKNLKYGNSALHGVGVLSKASVLEKLLARADDKIARIKNSDVLRKGDCGDLIGYLVLICAHQGWNNFDDQKD